MSNMKQNEEKDDSIASSKQKLAFTEDLDDSMKEYREDKGMY
jgi:hypothetical protein